MPERKRLTLAGALILKQVARALDDVADMFIRQVKKIFGRHCLKRRLVKYMLAEKFSWSMKRFFERETDALDR
jgi:hypothetical protein